MDARKKEIAELEQRKRKNLAALDTLLSRFRYGLLDAA